jgi:hypothetical protein
MRVLARARPPQLPLQRTHPRDATLTATELSKNYRSARAAPKEPDLWHLLPDQTPVTLHHPRWAGVDARNYSAATRDQLHLPFVFVWR